MPLIQASRLLTHLIALSAFSALVMNEFFHWIGSVLGLGLLAASFFLTLSGKKLNRAPRRWNGLSVLFCFFFMADLVWLSRDLLSAGMHFLTYLMVYRLLHLENSRDELQLYLISFLQLLAAAGDGSHFGYAISFLLSSFFMVGGLLLQHFRRERESRAQTEAPIPMKEAIPSRFLIIPSILTLIVLTVTLLVFFLIPRIGMAFFQKRSPSVQRTSGFSERVNLGSLGPIKLDPSSVMRVVPLSEEAGALPSYLRGMSFDAYDGRAWQNTLKRKTDLNRGPDEAFTVVSLPRQRTVLKKTILLEPIDTSVLFTADKAVSIQGPLPSLSRDQSGTLYFPSNPLRRIEYEITAVSEKLSEPDKKIVQIDYPSNIRSHYLPEEGAAGAGNASDPKIAALALEITGPYTTIHEKIIAVEHYLKSNYTYTLDVPPSRRPPLEEFLFYQKKGYCEYYASAMVVLLRSAGIASRLVTGFLPGEWNEIGKYYLVRQSDAHAWVEVYFPGERWLPFDPTPAVPQERNAVLKMTAAYLDWAQLKWDRYIVRYSLRDQFDFVQGAGERIGTLSDWSYSLVAGWKQWLHSLPDPAVAPVAILFLFLGGAFFFWVKRRGFQMRKGNRLKEISAVYAEMLRLVAKKGVVKKAHQTPFEFIEHVRAARQEIFKATEGITRIYCHVRFGGKALSPEEVAKIEALLIQLRAAP
jgi:transglutaminase-like putative cysteine protease